MARRDDKARVKQRGVSTGPVSVAGKKASSRNASSHGCRSETHVVLPDESAEEFEEMRAKWYREYPLPNALDVSLLERVAEREWHLRRCERMLDATQARILMRTTDPFAWTDEEHRVLQLMNRYHSKAERSFRAAWQDIENLRRNRIAEIRAMEGAKRAAYQNVVEGISQKPELDEDDEDEDELKDDPSADEAEMPDPGRERRRDRDAGTGRDAT